MGQSLDRSALSALYTHPAPERGWVRTNFVATLDGAAAGPDGLTGSINTAADRGVFALLRAHADVVLVGAGTVRAEGYRAITLAPWQRELRQQLGFDSLPTLAVLSHSLDLDPELARAVDGEPAGSVLVITDNSDGQRESLRSKDIEVIEVAGTGVARTAVAILAERGLVRILCEGGATLNRQLLAAGLVDDVCLTLAPTVIGGDMGRIVTGALLDGGGGAGAGGAGGAGVNCRLEHCLLGEDDTMITRWSIPKDPSVG